MRKALLLLGAGVLVFLSARILLRPERGSGPAADPAPGLVERADLPEEAAPDLYTEPPPAEPPWGAEAPARPHVRSLRDVGVPAPGVRRTPEQEAEARRADAAARLRESGAAGWGGGGGAPDFDAGGPDRFAARGVAGTGEAGVDAAGASAERREGRAAGASAEPREDRAGGAMESAAPPPADVPPAAEAGSALDSGAIAWSPATKLVKEAKDFAFGEKPVDELTLKLANDPVGRELLRAQAIDAGARQGLARLSSGGGRPSEEEALSAVRDAFKAAGIADPSEDELWERLAIAQLPAIPPPTPQEMMDFILRNKLDRPPTPEEVRRAGEAERAPRVRPEARNVAPKGPPPRSAREAYERVRDALEKGQRDFGVQPKHAFGIFGVESGFGRNTGRYNVMQVLRVEKSRRAPNTAGRRQTDNDIAAMYELERRGWLGGHQAKDMLGSYGASFGHTQFRPSSWLAYSAHPDGARQRDPYDMRTAVYSTASYLHTAGRYRARGVDSAIFAYNHDWGYVSDVKNMAERVESTIISPSRRRPR